MPVSQGDGRSGQVSFSSSSWAHAVGRGDIIRRGLRIGSPIHVGSPLYSTANHLLAVNFVPPQKPAVSPGREDTPMKPRASFRLFRRG